MRSYECQYLASLFCQSIDVIIKIRYCIHANFIDTGNIDQPYCRDELVFAIFTMILNNIIPRVMQSNARDERNEN